ncbi:MAG TPA: hypothetical protein VK157_07145 [Phycisphaerales bacterium]|nr:hypothetical protein [Phycisphaerales bacterium]
MRRLAPLLALILAAPALAQSFTYQGRLDANGSGASGNHDFEFRIFDLATDGVQQGTTTSTTQAVTDGLFTATINPVTNIFTGADRWLEVRVRPTGSGPFTTLPRQRLAAAPYAHRSLNERWSPLTSNSIRTDAGIERVFINTTTAPFSDSVLTISRTTAPTAFGGMYINTTDPASNPYVGWSTNNTPRAEAYVFGATGNWQLNVSGTPSIIVTPAGRTGLGFVPTGTERLQVNGDASITGTAKAAAFTYPTRQTRTLIIPAAAFTGPGTTHANLQYTIDGDGAYYFTSVTSARMLAPVNLPDGAVITALSFTYVDTFFDEMVCTLRRSTTTSNGGTVLATITSTPTGTNPGSTTVPIANIAIDNTTQYHHVEIFSNDWGGPDSLVKCVRITYTMPGPQ